ncbi:cathepsin d [Plakobranchus ocellatus]|uniref:Cathepsin d n=1 Tax=Plakobranchus ocellatus TaxID=259542 RepID=A0AAV3ZWH5_9GAST|nr:cathepsin d [Plakobranchus ocellatus]
MHFSLTVVFAFTLISVCAAQVKTLPVSQAMRPGWHSSVVKRPRKLPASQQTLRPHKQPLPKYSQPLDHLLQRPVRPFQPFPWPLHDHRLSTVARDVKLRNYEDVGGLMVRHQPFEEAILQPDSFEDTNFDGVLGLGSRGVFTDDEPSVFDNMVSQRLLPAPVFSLFLNRFNSSGPDSTLTIGGTNSDFYTGNFTFAPLTRSNRWQFELGGIKVSNHEGTISPWGSYAEVDSATPLIVGPLEEVDALNLRLGGAPLPGFPRKFFFDCSEVHTLPDVQFIVNGQKLSLSSKDYIVKDRNGQFSCFSLIVGKKWREETPMWTLGSPFMRAFYTQFDKGNFRIGFAKAKH